MFLEFLLLFLYLNSINGFSYGNDSGIKDWPEEYCYKNKGRQSPININTSTTIHLCPAHQSLNLEQYSKEITLEGLNDGNTAKFLVNDKVTIEDGGLRSPYKLVQFHFHWGSINSQGAEHTIDRRRFSMEVHFVHKAVEETIEPSSQFAVVGVLFTVGKPNPGLEMLISAFDQMAKPSAQPTVKVAGFNLDSLLPDDQSFYRYLGSLTTPICSEVVVWSLLKTPVTASSEQLVKFRSLINGDGFNMQDNFRPVQDLNGRRILDCHVEQHNQEL